MASLMTGICRSGCRRLSRIPPNITLVRHMLRVPQCCAYSSTSKKVDQSEFVIGKQTEVDPKRVEEIRNEDFRDPRIEVLDPTDTQYEWKGYYRDPIDDARTSKLVLFSSLSVTMVGIVFYFKYVPDLKGRVWARREALRVIERKKAAGEPYILPDFIPMDKLVVPTDEEMEEVNSL